MKNYVFFSLLLLIALGMQQSSYSADPEHNDVGGGVYDPELGIYATKRGSSVRNLHQRPVAEAKATIGEPGGTGQEARENTRPFSRVLLFSDPSRFVRIKADSETAADEIDFWVRQMSEHALFLYLGFDEPLFKEEARILHRQLERFRRRFNRNPRNIRLMNSLLPILKRERAFQIRALKALDEGRWIGWIFPLFINHITMELDYLVDKLNGIKYSDIDELRFWNMINSQHAAFAAHLLDPEERELFLKADELSVKFDKIPKSEREMMINLSLKASEELDKFNKTARAGGKHIKSIIHPVLLDHVIREGERSIKTLKALGLHDESAKFQRQYEEQVAQYNAGNAEE